jgi:four helix bundle protein
MRKRTKTFALRCVKLASTFHRGPVGEVVARQLVKSSTSVASNYSASCAARSHADFLNKLGIVEEEADESVFWIDFAADAGLTKRKLVEQLILEGREILAIIIASQKTAKARRAAAKLKGRPGT